MNLDRLPSCNRWHPTTESRIYLSRRMNGWGKTHEVRVCRVCRRGRQRTYVQGQTKPPKKINKTVRFDPRGPYGVLPALNWAPPQI